MLRQGWKSEDYLICLAGQTYLSMLCALKVMIALFQTHISSPHILPSAMQGVTQKCTFSLTHQALGNHGAGGSVFPHKTFGDPAVGSFCFVCLLRFPDDVVSVPFLPRD